MLSFGVFLENNLSDKVSGNGVKLLGSAFADLGKYLGSINRTGLAVNHWNLYNAISHNKAAIDGMKAGVLPRVTVDKILGILSFYKDVIKNYDGIKQEIQGNIQEPAAPSAPQPLSKPTPEKPKDIAPPTSATPPTSSSQADIVVKGVENNGTKLAIRFTDRIKLNKAYEEIQKANLYAVLRKDPTRDLYLLDLSSVAKYQVNDRNRVLKMLQKHKINVSPLGKYVEIPYFRDASKLNFIDIPNSNSIQVEVPHNPNARKPKKKDLSKMDDTEDNFLQQLIQYTFPDFEHDLTREAYTIQGTYKQFDIFEKLLKKFNYNCKALEEILQQKIEKGEIEKMSSEGDIPEGFIASVDKRLPENQFDLYTAQKEDIAHLYGRDSAILGSETGSGKCLGKDSLIQTSCGLFKMEDIWNKFAKRTIDVSDVESWGYPDNDIYVHSIDENGKVVKGQVVGLYKEKVNTKLKKITTWNGKKISATQVHKFLTPDGWTSDLKVDDWVCSTPNQFNLNINNFNDTKLAEFLGWQIAEGCEDVGTGRVRITQFDFEAISYIQKLYKSLGFSSGNIKTHKRNSNERFLEINCVNYVRFLKSLGYEFGYKSKDKKIPQFIMEANNEVIKVFLKSFFDGESYVSNSRRHISVSSASKILIYQISLLLQRFNISCSFHEKMKCATNGTKIKRAYYELNILGSSMRKFIDEIGFNYEYKRQSFNSFTTKNNYNKEGKPVCIAFKEFFKKYKLTTRLVGIEDRAYIIGKKFANNDTIIKFIEKFESLKSGNIAIWYKSKKCGKRTKTLQVLDSIEIKDIDIVIDRLYSLLNNDLQYEKVTKIEYIDYDDYVYDICVDKYHNYVAENLICHNTAVLVGAAELKMREIYNGRPTLIITIKDVVKQWVETIQKVCGPEEAKNISTDMLNPKKWTVLYYEKFSTGSKLIDGIHSMMAANFGILIIDELHKVKHADSKRSETIGIVANGIPTKWGASATVSSNYPRDVHNQLKMMGHYLGKIPRKKFIEEFEGYKDDADPDAGIRKAEILNKWLNLSGLYVRRTKSELNEKLPPISVREETTAIDQQAFRNNVAAKLDSWSPKAKDLPISQLLAAREVVAGLKTDATTEKALRIVLNGESSPNPAASKVVVFTNFISSGDALISKISNKLARINPNYKILTFTTGTPKKDQQKVKEIFTNDPNYKCLVMSMKKGGTGIDFPNAASSMVVNDFDWTPESAEQSEGRIYRINTTHPVHIFYTLSEGMDMELYEKVRRKRELAAIIQRWRQEFQKDKSNPEALSHIVDAQKEMKDIDHQMVGVVVKNLPQAGNAAKEELGMPVSKPDEQAEMQESFKRYINRWQEVYEEMFG